MGHIAEQTTRQQALHAIHGRPAVSGREEGDLHTKNLEPVEDTSSTEREPPVRYTVTPSSPKLSSTGTISPHTKSQQRNSWNNSAGACMPDPHTFNSSQTYVQRLSHFIVNSHLEGCCVSYHVAVSQSLKRSDRIPALVTEEEEEEEEEEEGEEEEEEEN